MGKTTNERFAKNASNSMATSTDNTDSIIVSHDRESVIGSSRGSMVQADLENI
jgi:hypothetical protein